MKLWRNWRVHLNPTRSGVVAARFAPHLSKWRTPLYAGCTVVLGSLAYCCVPYPSESIINLETLSKGRPVTVEELKSHEKDDTSIWVSVEKKVYDLTNFADLHPGGATIIQNFSGRDATSIFNQYHSPEFIRTFLKPENYVGDLIGDFDKDDDKSVSQRDFVSTPPISHIINLNDFEVVAKNILPSHAWSYYSTGANDEVTLKENQNAFRRIFFRPKILVEVEDIDITTEFLGQKVSAPFYCSAAAQAALGHPEGELSIARACFKENIIQMISSAASYSFEDITNACLERSAQWFQLYVTPERSEANLRIKECEEKGIKGIFVTVDTPWVGPREKQQRQIALDLEKGNPSGKPNGAKKRRQDPLLTWKDITSFKNATNIPIAIKGVQRVEDVLLAIERGVDAVVISNHGGRQLDFSRPSIEVLVEVTEVLKEKGLQNEIEIYIDGGIRRGSDVVKALCLGAKGVGLGRSFLYANSAYGEEGVRRAIQLLKDEIYMTMKLLGVKSLDDLKPGLLDIKRLKFQIEDC